MEKSAFFEILDKALRNSASDIHIGVGAQPMMRVDGELRTAGARDFTEDEFALMLADMGWRDTSRFENERALDFGCCVAYENNRIRLRVNLSYSLDLPSAAIRIIPARVKRLCELGLPPVLREIALRKSGLFIVSGPSGSGKSTTLAAMIEEINEARRVHIVTIVVPGEYIYERKFALIHQREAWRDARGFAEAMRSVVRQDPDVIMIGELRDAETAAAALNAAETGRLVLATLHTGSSAGSVDRMSSFFPAHVQVQIRARLAEVLIGVLSQRLARRVGGGLIAAAELLIVTNAVKSCIRESKNTQIADAVRSGASSGMCTMERELVRLYREGAIT